MKITKGDQVEIKSQGRTVRGTVSSAVNRGRKPWIEDAPDNWYIVVHDAAGIPHYWKQGVDGGSVKKLAAL